MKTTHDKSNQPCHVSVSVVPLFCLIVCNQSKKSDGSLHSALQLSFKNDFFFFFFTEIK